MNKVLELSKTLIKIPSISPEDHGCQELLIAHLKKLGFSIERISVGSASNFWARLGNSAPLLCFAGHTDVVPTGPLDQWSTDPFTPTENNGLLYGRGAADMKTGLAAMIIAAEEFLQHNQDLKGSIAFLITSAEEDYSDLGTPAVIKVLKERGEKIDYCIVGEPSSTKYLGDTIKIGRRGSLNGNLRIKGTQGHIAYPHLADNPIHKALTALLRLTQNVWDQGNQHFPPTQFQISNIQAGTGASNVIPGELKLLFNFRFAPSSTVETLKATVETCLQEAHLNYELDWQLSGEPFYCEEERFIATCTNAVQHVTGLMPELSTAGGTSDGRFIAPTGAKVVEIGLVNQTIHQVNECTLISDLEKLKDIYMKILGATLATRD